MVQPKYSPQEALERVKLMMSYDSSKTLKENKENIKQPLNEVVFALPWLMAGSSAIMAGIGAWIYNSQGGGDSISKTKTFFQGCDTNIKNLKPTVTKTQYREAADKIFNAIDGPGTNEDEIKSALSSMPTVADLCALNSWYNTQYGNLFNDLDEDIDGTDFTKYVWSAIAPTIADAGDNLEDSKKEEGKKEDGKKEEGKQPVRRQYVACSGTSEQPFKKLCYEKDPNGPLHKVQSCIGVTPDGKFWDKTEKALVQKTGKNSFTINDVNTICGTKPDTQKPSIDDEFGTGEEEASSILDQ